MRIKFRGGPLDGQEGDLGLGLLGQLPKRLYVEQARYKLNRRARPPFYEYVKESAPRLPKIF